MRVIIFCLSFLIAAAQPASAHIQSDLSTSQFTITQQGAYSFQHNSQDKSLSLAVVFIDIDEDEITDHEHKGIHLVKKGHHASRNLLPLCIEKNSLRINSAGYFFRLHPSLFLFIGSFRL